MVVAHDGTEGLEAYREHAPDCIVLDLMLPGLDGWQVLREVRQVDGQTQIVVLTALGDAKYRTAGLRDGADDFLTKPFNLDELVLRVQKRAEVRQGTRIGRDQRDRTVREIAERLPATVPAEARQPLAVVIGYGKLIADPSFSASQVREMAAAMATAGQRLAELPHLFATDADKQTASH